ncbi:hypothetical protein HPB48_006519 [Haemaphysalis longicornis]|uniref:Uncharacterized protein n=1 Tax=Haemaphysalis longicornis TaxID=44386 RepID=A0A9J6FXP0_HAELO|nr:hypothetical protein HPB48_006519 [Haemaphysalis longicornis]
MQVVCMDTAQHEDYPPFEEEYLKDMIRIWRRKHSSKAPKGNDAPGQQQTAARSATGDVCKGVITIDPNGTSASLKPKLRWKNGEILSVRRLGSSNVAVVIFYGKFVPRQIYYNDQGIPVRLYKKTIPACHRGDTVGHRADICPRPKPGRCDQCGSKEDFKKIQASQGGHKTSTPVSGRPAPVKNNTGSWTVSRTQIFSAEDFPTLPNAQNDVSDWVRAASRPRCSPSLLTTPTEVAIQRQNAELRRQSEILANKIQELETRLAGLTESQTTAGTSEPMQQSEPSERDESASVASGVSSASRCSDRTFVQHVPKVEQRLSKLERAIEELPKKILEGVRASFAELWQQERVVGEVRTSEHRRFADMEAEAHARALLRCLLR